MYYPKTVVQRRGFTALELIIVLVVGFSIIALSASKMGQLFSASSTAAAMGSILDLYTSTRSLRGATGYGDGDLLEPLIKAQMVPKGLAIIDKTLRNEWNGAIEIKATNDGFGFDLTYPNVPVEACTKMAQNLLNSGSFMTIKLGTKAVKASDPVATIVEGCASNGGKGVVMVFQFTETSEIEKPPAEG